MKYVLVIAAFLFCQRVHAQDIIQNKTNAIIDTTTSKLNQAMAIYSWISQNIRYDVEAYLKGHSENVTVFETFTRKKGICWDYALLYQVMCKDAGIETYIVSGYSIGPELFQGGGYYRANHCWNVFHIDSTWYQADPTWGSGNLKAVPSTFDKLNHIFFNVPCVNKKLKFISSPTMIYFNPEWSSFFQTHLPLDPKWQNSGYPLTFKSFETGSPRQYEPLSDYKNRLLNYHNLSEKQRMFEDGVYGKRFNPKNNFDIALGYVLKASEFDLKRISSDSSNLYYFKTNLDDYQKAKQFISLYRDTTDSIFTGRMKMLKNEISQAKMLSKDIVREYTIETKSHLKQQIYISRWKLYLNKINSICEKQIAVQNKINLNALPKIKSVYLDSSAHYSNDENLNHSLIKCLEYKTIIDSLYSFCKSKIVVNQEINILFNTSKETFKQLLDNFDSALKTEKNTLILPIWKNLFDTFFQYRNQYQNKNKNLVSVKVSYSQLTVTLKLMISEYTNQQNLIGKYFMYTQDTSGVKVLYRLMNKTILDACTSLKKLTAANKVLLDTEIQFVDVNHFRNMEIKLPAKLNITLFLKYDEILLADQERLYKIEKSIIKPMVNLSTNRIQILTRIIEKKAVQRIQ